MKRSYSARICVLATLCAFAGGGARAGSAIADAPASPSAPQVARAALDFRVSVHASMALRIEPVALRVQGGGAVLSLQGPDGQTMATTARRGVTDLRVALVPDDGTAHRLVTLAAP